MSRIFPESSIFVGYSGTQHFINSVFFEALGPLSGCLSEKQEPGDESLARRIERKLIGSRIRVVFRLTC